ncbi:prephenate/arogenate dehydrogenase family protein [Oceanibaculum pacificum]|uniref:prephenate dehydrogenase n=1 Tax=Oceanibaculum pacificum TaxID=580166 RepID=A0A154WF35_9PROT|nr:prephenate/arogenate dehydrogenase family protein [Oceanibaculum pacificum]KZD12109.1 cyclohexadienyl dehydrogenase [Oceanibaculum pacificum]
MTEIATKPLFQRLALVGAGLIGSSIAHAARRGNLAGHIAITTRSPDTLKRVRELGFADSVHDDIASAVAGADLVILCVPVGACGRVAEAMKPHLAPGAIVSDVGSVKQAVIRDMLPHIPAEVHFVPGHPIAGTEHSGPDSGFAELFDGRWCILTPLPDGDANAAARLRAFWEAAGSTVTEMEAEHHDKVLAITSHLPHLIAYTIVGTAVDLEESTKNEVIKFSAGGFRDFTRIAASDPVMWRDVFLNNREAVLEMLQRFSEDLSYLQRAIRWGEGDKLEEMFTRTRAIRRGIIAAKQA